MCSSLLYIKLLNSMIENIWETNFVENGDEINLKY